MKKLITTCAFLMLISSTYAYTKFVVGDIEYTISSDTTVVVTNSSVTYTGSITIPSTVVFSAVTYNVTALGYYVFSECTGLTSVTIPSSVSSIGGGAFFGCTGLTSITIPDSVTSIGYNTFYGCTGLTSITIPSSVTSIDSQAFYGCSGLTSVTIPSSVTSIAGSAFYDTEWYNNQPDGLVYLDNWVLDYKGTMPANTSIVLNAGTKGIAGSTFYDCSGLTSITIPNSLTSIGGSAFSNCYFLTSITIPSSVTSIGSWAFNDCINLSSIYAHPTTPVDLTTSTNVFYDVSKTRCTLYVPIGSVSAYDSAAQWQDFTNIVEMPSAVKDINLQGLNIYTQGTSIVVEHAQGYTVSVYNVSGQKVSEVTNPASTQAISVPQAGVYVIKIADKTQKVVVK